MILKSPRQMSMIITHTSFKEIALKQKSLYDILLIHNLCYL